MASSYSRLFAMRSPATLPAERFQLQCYMCLRFYESMDCSGYCQPTILCMFNVTDCTMDHYSLP